MSDSRAIGLGDESFNEELARPLDQRQIIPMIHEPQLSEQARAVYEVSARKPDNPILKKTMADPV